MTPERYRQVGQLYQAALELEPDTRADFLAGACGGDDELRREVESLLQAHNKAGDYFAAPALKVAADLLAAQTVPSLAGQSLGHYQVLSLLGAGGMGEVYLAQDARLGRKVALKLLPAAFITNADRLRRFGQEARAASALNHPNIITVFDIDEAVGVHYIATEFIDGQTLRQRMAGARLDLQEALDVTVQVASALTAAHEAGVLHRDIKPENVMERRDGIVKVLDFGLAKLTEQRAPADPAAPVSAECSTEAGAVLGTPRYMSPEQARGQKVDARTDIFSLGAVLYEMVSGHAPFEGATSAEVVAAILEREPLALSGYADGVPAELERITQKALRKRREERYQAAQDMLVDLKALQRQREFEADWARATSAETVDAALRGSGGAHRTSQGQPARASQVATVSTVPSGELPVSGIKRSRTGVVFALAAAVLVGVGLAAGLYQMLSRGLTGTPPSEPFQQMRITKLTNIGNALVAAISPGGEYVAYAVDEGGKQSLWLRHIPTSSAVRIVPPDYAVYYGLTFTPDGYYVYYSVFKSNQADELLYRVPVLGGVPPQKVLTRINNGLTFSPDGKRLAYIDCSSSQQRCLLLTTNASGGEAQTLVVRKYPDIFSYNEFGGPAWSPDGKVIVLAAGTRGQPGRYLVEVTVADGMQRRIITQQWANMMQVAWMPDGNGLVIVAKDEAASPYQLWYLPYPAGAVRRVTNDLLDYRGVSLTAKAEALVTAQSEAVSSIWVAPSAAASQAKRITAGVGQLNGNDGLAWTPDGRIIYRSNASGKPELWAVRADGTDAKPLTIDSKARGPLSVSPDGRSLIFTSDRTGIPHIWRMEIDGSQLEQLTDGKGEASAHLSPDGEWLIYQPANQSANSTLWKKPIGGGQAVQLTKELSQRAVVSPDGKLVAYFSPDSSAWGIAIVPLTGGEPLKRFRLPPSVITRVVRWVPNGQALAFIDDRNGVSNLWLQPLDGSAPRKLTSFMDGQIFFFEWSRNGQQLALARGTSTSDLVLISNLR